MKSILKSVITILILFLFINAGFVKAQDNKDVKRETAQNTDRNFIDKNKDGVCDNYPNAVGRRVSGLGPKYIDKNNDGICDNRSHEIGKGKNQGHRGSCNGTRKGWRGRR